MTIYVPYAGSEILVRLVNTLVLETNAVFVAKVPATTKPSCDAIGKDDVVINPIFAPKAVVAKVVNPTTVRPPLQFVIPVMVSVPPTVSLPVTVEDPHPELPVQLKEPVMLCIPVRFIPLQVIALKVFVALVKVFDAAKVGIFAATNAVDCVVASENLSS